MIYNSQRENLIIPEYGRHVQNLINHAKGIEDKEQRQLEVNTIANLMIQMHPQHKNLLEYRDKIWKHIFRIANYDLDVETPSGVRPTPEEDDLKPDIVSYPKRNSTFRHYGSYLKSMIEKANAIEEEPKRLAYYKVIGSFMKMAYKNWNREHYVNDEIIKADLKKISEGTIVIAENVSLDGLLDSIEKRRKPSNKHHAKSNNNRGRHRNNNRKRR